MNSKYLRLIAVLLLGFLPGAATASPRLQDQARIPLWGDETPYWIGLNYPWYNYGTDFGGNAWGHSGISSEDTRKQVEADFADMQRQGVRVVRWFVFTDGRAGLVYDETGKVMGLDEYVFADFDAALAIAQEHDIYLMPVLFDFHFADSPSDVDGVQTGGRRNLVADADIRQSLIDNALKPLFVRYADHPTIVAWDIMNEPEWVMDIAGGGTEGEPVSPAVMLVFVNEVADTIHDLTSQSVTLGSASRGWLELWEDTRLDFFQYHYYDKFESQYPFDVPYADLGLDKPVIVGEFPTEGSGRDLADYLETIWQNGYAGAFAWSYRADDSASDFGSQAADFSDWSQAHKSDVDIVPPSNQIVEYDFESGDMGWVAQDYETDQACLAVEQSDAWQKDGEHALAMSMNLIGQDSEYGKGETFVDLTQNPPNGIMGQVAHLDLNGKTISIWVFPPELSQGDSSNPNGFQVFVKDENGASEYGCWHPIKAEGAPMRVRLTVSGAPPENGSSCGFYIADGFDPSKIKYVGIKMGAGGGSEFYYVGNVYVDAVNWE